VKKGRVWERGLKLLGFVAITILTLFPLYWMINVSLLPEKEVIRSVPHLFPSPAVITIKSYGEILTKHEVPRYLFNSIAIVLPASAITLFSSFAVAYALAKYRFRLRNFTQYFIIWLVTLPWVIYVLPIFIMASPLGLLDSHILMILLYGFSGIPLFSWFALPYLHSFPNELVDASRLDGCSE
jgi:ABC-type glycerol-3-phosphate transport system permease component